MSDFSNIAALAQAATQAPQPTENMGIRKLFMLMHGAYGNGFVSKFSTGERDAQGKDKGIRSAMQVWAHGLSQFSPDVIELAASRFLSLYPEFPPNLPQFQAICHSAAPRKTFAEQNGYVALPPPKPAPDVKFDAVGDGKDWARRILAGIEAGYRKSPTVELFAKQALGVAK